MCRLPIILVTVIKKIGLNIFLFFNYLVKIEIGSYLKFWSNLVFHILELYEFNHFNH